MTDFLRDSTTGALVFTDGDLVITPPLEAAAQHIRERLELAQGEWFLDLEDGVPWRERVLVRNPDIAVISAILRERILGTPEVLRLASFDLRFTRVTGELRLAFVAIVEGGQLEATAQGPDLAALLLNLLIKPLGGIL